jgi:hypothetical protein
MAKSKFFRVFVEGATASDGRKIEAAWIDQIVSNFNRTTYQPRINCEHIKGFSPEPPFNAYGDVAEVKAQTDDLVVDGKSRKVRALYAALEPNDQLLAINAKGQKIFTSVEISPNFAGTGKFGMVGLAVTDNPASLGTEALTFSGLKPMFDARKEAPENLFTASEEAKLEMEETPATPAVDASAGFFAAATAFFQNALKGGPVEQPKPVNPPATPPAPANDNAAFTALAQGVQQLSEGVQAMNRTFATQIGQLRSDHDGLTTQLATTDNSQERRPPAAGGGNFARTDC